MWIGLGIGMLFLVGSFIMIGSKPESATPTTTPVNHYDGSNWSKMDSGTTSPLLGVWGSSASDVFAVGH